MVTDAPAFLSAAAWRERERAHRARAERWTLPARERRGRRVPHPIDDFLFVYYPFSFGKLEAWHPGMGTALEVGEEVPEAFTREPYRVTGGVAFLDAGLLVEKDRQRLRWTLELLEATRDRAPNFACHGLHEWAMVYRGKEVRHEKTTPLRLPQEEIDAVVESRPVVCSHFDAFRFFAPEAQPLNRLQPTLMDRPGFEQPACIHANMDLYKWAAKSMPWIGAELLLDCFELAVKLRDLDMRASPYDLGAWGRVPVRIETPEGRREYEGEQRALAAEAAVLRGRLIAALGWVR
ncbi:hypothetical protein [Luteolibacter sp. LG18]|uniref:hypothetical protein n=1 Tax=Luteolibacter sp. LG18 TaxID=2819286 RepID=UPI0030C6DFD4